MKPLEVPIRFQEGPGHRWCPTDGCLCQWLSRVSVFLIGECLQALHSTDPWPQKHVLSGVILALAEPAGERNM